MAESSDSFTQSASTSEQKDNVNISKTDESENSALIDDSQNLEKVDSSLNLALESLVLDKESGSPSNISKKDESENTSLIDDSQNLEKVYSSLNLALEPLVLVKVSDSSSNLLEEVNLDNEAEVREIELQDVQTSENSEETAVKIINRRLLNIRAACFEYELRLNTLLHRLRAQIQECISMRHETRVVQLRETLSQWQPLYDTLVEIISRVELIMKGVKASDFLSDRFVGAVMRTCDKLEVHLHNLRSSNIPV